jgi:hypothetical protein
MKSTVFVLLLACLIACANCQTPVLKASPLRYSPNFYQAINVAMSNVLGSNSFQNYYTSIGLIDPPPPCSSDQYPPTFEANQIIMCYEDDPDNQPFVDLYQYVGLNLTSALNQFYGNSTNPNPIKAIVIPMAYNTTVGFFDSVISFIEEGLCDMDIGAAIVSSTRQDKVHYLCPYGSVVDVIVRGPWDPSMNLTSIAAIQAAGSAVVITVISQTPYVTFAKTKFPNANVIPVTNMSIAFDMLSNNQTHVFLYDSLDIDSYKIYFNNSCPECQEYPYGNPTRFGGFLLNSAPSLSFSILFTLALALTVILYSNMPSEFS